MSCIQETQFVLISLEGNIGAGKTTLLDLIREAYPDALYLKEPVDNWQNINGDSNLNLLEKYYSDPNRWGFTFQMYAFQSRLMEWCKQKDEYILQRKKLSVGQDKKQILVFTERSLESDRKIFLENARLTNLITDIEYQVYCQLYDFNSSKSPFNLQGAIYLDLPSEFCLQRLKKRQRFEEVDTIQLEYLQQLENRHDTWFSEQNTFKLLKIDSARDYRVSGESRSLLLDQIKLYISQLLDAESQ